MSCGGFHSVSVHRTRGVTSVTFIQRPRPVKGAHHFAPSVAQITEWQIVGILKKCEAGLPINDLDTFVMDEGNRARRRELSQEGPR